MAGVLTDYLKLQGRVGILGGTFDPVQPAHIAIANLAFEEFNLETILFIPAQQNPLKTHSPLSSDDHRIAMLELALESSPKYFISRLEIDAETNPSFTIDTLRTLEDKVSPNASLFLILGTDNLPTLNKWKEITSILNLLSGVILVNREDGQYEQFLETVPEALKSFQEKFHQGYLDSKPLPHSSRSIREQLQKGLTLDTAEMDPHVLNYIQKHQLYR